MVRSDAGELLLGSVGLDAVEEDTGLPAPLLEVGAQQRDPLLLVGDLAERDLLRLAALDQLRRRVDADVLDPLDLAPGRGQIAAAVEVERVDRRPPRLARLAADDLELARARDADSAARQ